MFNDKDSLNLIDIITHPSTGLVTIIPPLYSVGIVMHDMAYTWIGIIASYPILILIQIIIRRREAEEELLQEASNWPESLPLEKLLQPDPDLEPEQLPENVVSLAEHRLRKSS